MCVHPNTHVSTLPYGSLCFRYGSSRRAVVGLGTVASLAAIEYPKLRIASVHGQDGLSLQDQVTSMVLMRFTSISNVVSCTR